MSLSKNVGKVFNDSIHGHVELHPLLVKIVDTPQFQRLRNIKQLGGAYFVFPGASHNRFEHSIGVGHLAGEFAKALKSRQPELNISDRDILCVQIAGLCHDVGHGPFSHLYDMLFIPEARRNTEWKHEDASLKMFDYLVKVNNLETEMKKYGLNPEEDLDFIKELISGRPLIPKSSENTATDPWPYKGRGADKSFLYEIVANKLNGIDVDKFDYFARDCHHLGIQRNFDHLRFFMYTRVCEVNGRKHICSRDKEVGNLYDMFHMRNCLHRRAYQHRVTKNIEIMIRDALLKADKHIEIEGSEKNFILSEAIDDMKAYTKLTDQVLEKILYPCSCLTSSSPDMIKASEIIQRIISRDLYEFLGEAKDKEKTGVKIPKEKIESLKKALAEVIPKGQQKRDNFEVFEVSFDYGMKDKDPIKNTYFYKKSDLSHGDTIKDQVSKLLPECFSEQIIRVYWKTKDVESQKNAKVCFEKWCNENDFEMMKN